MKKEFIKNRKGQKIAVLVEIAKHQNGLVFVMHGLSGTKEQLHIQAIAEAFLENGYTVIRFDTTNSFGESAGRFEDATFTNYFEDLEDVIAWAASQPWYEEPFVLAGHSLGGISVARYAEAHPEKVKGLAPLSTVVSGKLSLDAMPKYIIEHWRKTGWWEDESASRPGVIKRLPWSHAIDRLKFDLAHEAQKLTMPVLMIVGDRDDRTPRAHEKILYDLLPGPRELHIIKGAGHTFRTDTEIRNLKLIVKTWVKKYFC